MNAFARTPHCGGATFGRFRCRILAYAAALAVSPVQAQAPASGQRPDPADAAVVVPSYAYRSALADYRPLPEETVAPWRESNDLVARIGGWRAYAREAAQATGGASPAPAAVPSVPR